MFSVSGFGSSENERWLDSFFLLLLVCAHKIEMSLKNHIRFSPYSKKRVNIVDTDKLSIAQFNLWTTHQCDENFDLPDPDVKECGMDQMYYVEAVDNATTCGGIWVENTISLKIKTIKPAPKPADNLCIPLNSGIYRPSEEILPKLMDLPVTKDVLSCIQGMVRREVEIL